MPNEDVRRELDNQIRQLTAVIGRTPGSLSELLDTTFTGTSSSRTVTVTLDFRGVLRGVRIADGTLIHGDERALEAAIMDAHAHATATMTNALTSTPTNTRPETPPHGHRRSQRRAEPTDFEEPSPILRTRY